MFTPMRAMKNLVVLTVMMAEYGVAMTSYVDPFPSFSIRKNCCSKSECFGTLGIYGMSLCLEPSIDSGLVLDLLVFANSDMPRLRKV